MRNLISNIGLFVTSIFSIFILISHIAPHISPNTFVIPQFFGIIYPYLVATNILIAIFWLLRKKLVFLIPLISLLSGYNHIANMVGVAYFETETLENTKQLKVVSYNVRLFDLYNWSKNKETRNKILTYLDEINADIVCFQEYYDDLTNEFETTSEILKSAKMKYHKIAPSYVAKDLYRFGIATFSRFPIVNSGEISFKNSQNNCLWTDLLIEKDTVRVYNIHLQSNHFEIDDYEFIRKINTSPTSIEFKQLHGFFTRLSIAYRKRADQAEKIAEHMAQTTYAKLVCADLNDTHLSYAYQQIRGNFKDSFRESGFGLGHSFGSLLTSVRIDYIFYDKNFISTSFQTGKPDLSDHKPIIGVIEKK
ncbi:MAG: endonuclease/exonuclease/phosphatase family protein [Salinivirgaceae bacterium]|nr:endonuclease/exonuclease/phosphatase family protein [Salinivirgaceae bacterium]MDD4746065.1 endonuclease/exonuclease/phosphatase family protein [Salinivirgaceae bacterium]MDY0281345.1 endonuclease/exonuclease/phosphatase family protein [Salinivirgaceae bacterium]